MSDVLVVGAGPAGSVAALILARAGVKVRLIDREVFPRDKLCGDTVSPGAIAFLDSIGLRGGPLAGAHRLRGMVVSSPIVQGRLDYAKGVEGCVVARRAFDMWLLEHAIAAGATFEPGIGVRDVIRTSEGGRARVRGVVAAARRASQTSQRLASMTIAADGRQSTIARALKLTVDRGTPRRWAWGLYARGIPGTTDAGEMHIRPSFYLGIAPLGPDLANLLVVTPPRPPGGSPMGVLRRAIASDPQLAARFAHVQYEGPVRVLGPLAADRRAVGSDGVLLAGDAAGFTNPMTGDGVYLAVRGAALAAEATLHALETGDFSGAPARLQRARQRALGSKIRFNRLARAIVDRPALVTALSRVGQVAEWPIRLMVKYAAGAKAK